MKSVHLTMMLFCHTLLASFTFYFSSSPTLASPISGPNQAPQVQLEAPKLVSHDHQQSNQAVKQAQQQAVIFNSASSGVVPAVSIKSGVYEPNPIKASPAHQETPRVEPRSQPVVVVKEEVAKQFAFAPKKFDDEQVQIVKQHLPDSARVESPKVENWAAVDAVKQEASKLEKQKQIELKEKIATAKEPQEQKKQQQQQTIVGASLSPQVNGGLGPLHLLATTLCSYQPDRAVGDDTVNQLYARRAIVRKSLLDFMSLKFTNLEKLSSRLGVGLQVVPVKSVPDSASQTVPSSKPSHGWPVVGKCTAYDLRLMGEAAWCECREEDQTCNQLFAPSQSPSDPMAASSSATISGEQKTDKQASDDSRFDSSKQKSFLSIDIVDSFSPEQSSVISKILHVGDIKDAPVVESAFYNLNLTQHQLATLEAQTISTQECRRNALRYTKSLFQHLAEDQQSRSESWPKLYAQISVDDCARKRMIDIINALSSFRTDTTSIRRDNVEFAFAMDDLRTKVLENEVNVPLTFDRHFIEVEQFLQQSVRLMLSSVQPKRAKLTSLRYRSLMYGTAANLDEQQQCIDLHQRLLAKNYPNDCNPTQFGQLPDVLRMTANSLELWSIEKELSLYLAKIADYPNITPAGQQKVKEDVNECIANLVAS